MTERDSPGDFWLIPFCLLPAAETFLLAQDAVRVSVRESLVYE